jgi:hypothetical protein
MAKLAVNVFESSEVGMHWMEMGVCGENGRCHCLFLFLVNGTRVGLAPEDDESICATTP